VEGLTFYNTGLCGTELVWGYTAYVALRYFVNKECFRLW
jgi:hypothetical protein